MKVSLYTMRNSNMSKENNAALFAEHEYKTKVEEAHEYLENFDILETITNVGNDEVFTPRTTVDMMLDSLPEEVWHNSNYKWLNPASKNGIFEREIAIRLDKGLEDVIKDKEERRKHILQNMIFAFGQTRFTANVARRTLYYCSQANKQCDGIKASDGHYENGFAIGNGTWFNDAEGNIKTPNVDHTFVPNGKDKSYCKHCHISSKSEYNDKNQRETYAYEFIHIPKQKLHKYLQERFFQGDTNMKFDIIIGNPPYQLSDGGGVAKSSAIPIYNLFVNNSLELEPKYLCMIIPSRWMEGGKGLDDFRNSMINDKHIRLLCIFNDSKECFPNNDIKGGVCYFLWDRDNNKPCEVYTHNKDEIVPSTRYLKELDIDIFVRDPRLLHILKHLLVYKYESFENIVSPRKPYGLSADIFKDPQKYNLPPISDTEISGGYSIIGLDEHQKRIKKYIPKDYPLPKKEGLDQYKVFIAKAYGCGAIGEVPSTPVLSTPGELCTETLLQIGPFDAKEEATNVVKYIKTKFFRCIVGVKKQTQNAAKQVYGYVPMQDFSDSSDIDWTMPIHDIDLQLYKKYNLSDEDIDFIEKNIEEMA